MNKIQVSENKTNEIESINQLTDLMNFILSCFALEDYDKIIELCNLLKETKSKREINCEKKLDHFVEN